MTTQDLTQRFMDPKGNFLTNRKNLNLTEDFEGLVLTATSDGYGTPTYGYGRILHPDGTPVQNGDQCPDQATAESWLLTDLYGEAAKYVRAFVNASVIAAMSDDEFGAWVDLTFNRGCGRFRDHVASFLNSGDHAGAVNALTSDPALHTVGGNYNLGLDRRRWAERYVIEGKDWTVFQSLDYFKAFKARGYQ